MWCGQFCRSHAIFAESDANGRLQAEILNARVSLENGQAPLLDRDGSAWMAHAGPDDY